MYSVIMPKRKYGEDDYYSRKIRKLERKLKRARAHKHRSTRSTSPSNHSLQDVDIVTDDLLEEHQPLNTADLAQEVNGSKVDGVPEQAPSTPVNEEQDSHIQTHDLTHDPIDDDILEILGKDFSSDTEYGPNIHNELSARLQHIATAGLDKETRKELSNKYRTPANCTKIEAPLLNIEIKAALPEATFKRDKGIAHRQKQIASAISCLSEVISSQLNSKDKDSNLLKKLMDATKILCDSQYSDTMKRRYFACTTLKRDITEHISKTKVDKYLFGENLAETLKCAKAVSKSSFELKSQQNSYKKQVTQQPQPSTSKNWKTAPAIRKPFTSGPQRGRPVAGQPSLPPPPAPQTRRPPATSSRQLRYQSRQTHRQ